MSLKVFHLVFITVCVTLCAFVTAWGLRNYLTTHDSGSLMLSGAFLISGFGLVVYGIRAYHKLKELS